MCRMVYDRYYIVFPRQGVILRAQGLDCRPAWLGYLFSVPEPVMQYTAQPRSQHVLFVRASSRAGFSFLLKDS